MTRRFESFDMWELQTLGRGVSGVVPARGEQEEAIRRLMNEIHDEFDEREDNS